MIHGQKIIKLHTGMFEYIKVNLPKEDSLELW